MTTDASVRQTRLAENLSTLRVRRATLLEGDRWMLVVGGTLLPLGLIVVLIGYLGASRTVLVFEQVPYLLSGAAFGLGLVVTGGFVYFAYWLTILVKENRSGLQDLTAVMLRMETLLQEQSVAATAPRTRKGTPSPTLVATKTGTMLHRPDCIAVEAKTDLRSVTATTAGLTPCKLCDPFGDG